MQAFLAPTRTRPGTRVGARYTVPLDGLGKEELDDEKQRLTLQAKASFGAPPPPFEAFEVKDGTLSMPRFYGLWRFGAAETDARCDGVPIALDFQGTLTPVQTQAMKAVTERHLAPTKDGGVMISLPCGMGKTVLAVRLCAHLGRKTAVLVHKGVLRDQWKEAFERFCPTVKVGFVQGKAWEVDGCDVVIFMIMTLAKRCYDPSMFSEFGVVVVDEAHHVAAPVMSGAMAAFDARYIVGLSATKDRPDGLTPLLHWSLGHEGFRAERNGGETVRVSVATFPNGCREVLRKDGKPLVAIMITNLAKNVERNRFLARRIAHMRGKGRVLMVLSDRIEQLDILRTMVVELGIPASDVGVFKGGMRDDDRVEALARPVVMCSYGMANEGVDKKEADTCVLATPKSRVVQCIGRVQRPCATKQSPLVLDVADDVSIFAHLRWTRQRLYSKEKYEVQVLPHDVDDGPWFA